MPSYKVISKGFFAGKTYDPEGKRKILTVEKPFKKCPAWLQPLKAETAAQKKKREAHEAKQEKLDAEKAEQDKQDIADASFMGEGESAGKSTVTTL